MKYTTSLIRTLFTLIFVCLCFFSCSSEDKKPTLAESSDCMKYLFANDLEKIKEYSSECVNFRGENAVTMLMMAASKGYIEIADYLLQKGVNVNSVNNIRQSALHFAVVGKHPKVIELLVQNGAENKPNNFGITPLMMAVSTGTMEMVELMNPTFEDVNIAADDGWTAIYFAIRKQDETMLKFLLDRGTCVNFADSYSQTPYDFAKETGWKFALPLIKKGKVCKNK